MKLILHDFPPKRGAHSEQALPEFSGQLVEEIIQTVEAAELHIVQAAGLPPPVPIDIYALRGKIEDKRCDIIGTAMALVEAWDEGDELAVRDYVAELRHLFAELAELRKELKL